MTEYLACVRRLESKWANTRSSSATRMVRLCALCFVFEQQNSWFDIIPFRADGALAFRQLCRILSWDLSGIFRESEDELLLVPNRSPNTRVPGSELPPKLTAPLKLLTLQIERA